MKTEREDPEHIAVSIPLKPYYVYALVDPSDQQRVFYVGKGRSTRAFDHRKQAFSKTELDTEKFQKIREIERGGNQVLASVLGRFDTEAEAFAVETTLIHWMYGLENLTNIQSGHGARYVRNKNSGFEVITGIDIPRNIRMAGALRTGYLDEIIARHEQLGHFELARELFVYLKQKGISILYDDVISLEAGRYVGIVIQINSTANLVLQLTSSSNHRLILNLKPVSELKQDRMDFEKFLKGFPSVKSKNGSRYAKLAHWNTLKFHVGDLEEIFNEVKSTQFFFAGG